MKPNFHAKLSVNRLSCKQGDRLLFRELSFELHAGELLFLLGHNGSGKTSLLRLLALLMHPDEGQITWCDHALDSYPHAYREQLLYLGHKPALSADLTPRENLSLISALMTGESDRSDHALHEVAMLEYADVQVHRLSAGQKQRVALARLILQKAQLWILDEPTTSLDHESQQWLEQKIHQHLAALGMVVIASHQPLTFVQSTVKHLQLLGNGMFHFV